MFDNDDALDAVPVPDATTPELGMVFMGATIAKAQSAAEMIDEGKKLVFLLDVSSSMGAGMDSAANRDYSAPRVTRMELLKKLTVSEIAKRKAKYPKAETMVYQFGARVRPVKAEEGDIMGLHAGDGDTKGAHAILGAMANCIKKPSKMGIHHLILVTDGEFSDSGELYGKEQAAKDAGCVVDGIVIGKSENSFSSSTAFVEFCKETGGTVTYADSVEEFQQKFLAATARMICAPSN